MKLSKIIITLSVPFVLLATVGSVMAQTTIDTTGAWNGKLSTSPFGAGPGSTTQTYGETFTTPATSNSLTSFQFFISAENFKVNTDAYVYAWNGTQATGSALFSTGPFLISGGKNSFSPYTVNTGGLNLTSGTQYVMFFSTSGITQPTQNPGVSKTSQTKWGITTTNPDPGGNFVFLNSGNNTSLFTTATWKNQGSSSDLAFKAIFAPVPELSEIVTMSIGLLGLGGLMLLGKKRSKMQTAA